MTDTEMLQYCKDNFPFAITTESGWNDIKMVFKDGYNNGYELGERIANGAIESLQKKNAELSKALEESESREKELCILAENMKAELKKIRCAYITEKVGNLCNGVDTDNLFKSAK